MAGNPRDHRPARRRPRGRPRGTAAGAPALGLDPGRRRGPRRRDGRRARGAAPPRRDHHGSPHAGDGRHRGDGGDHPRACPTRRCSSSPPTRSARSSSAASSPGARGYILKEAPHETLLRAIEKVAAGETFVDPALMSALTKSRDGSDVLTAREREILQLLADGMSNADVAAAALHLAGDGQEPRAPHPHEARGRHAHAGRRDRAARRDDRLIDPVDGDERSTDDADRQARALAERLRAERDERRRLAELIHDGPVQLLAAIDADARRRAGRATPAATRQPPPRSSSGRSASRRRRTSTSARSSAESSRTRCSELGLAAAIAELAERHTVRRGVAFDLDLAAADWLGDGAQSGLYQIVRDALDQAVRRGPPTKVDDHDRAPRAAASSSGSPTTAARSGARPSSTRSPSGRPS